ncbi:MAG: hypothetical protein WC538_22995 [Thermoanaerobaculia bacterium]|jgi:hypothetical protein
MKPFTSIASVVLALIAAMQLIRFIQAWPVSINGFSVPVWASAIASVVAALLAVMIWREKQP